MLKMLVCAADIAERRTVHKGAADYFIASNNDLQPGKSLKKAPVVWRVLFLIFATVCGLYMFFVCGRQINIHMRSRYVLLRQLLDKGSCQNPVTKSAEYVPLHYPIPKTYTRCMGLNWDECACTAVHLFAILSMQRSGSGWFETLLNSHPNISSHGEIFSVKERRQNFSTISQTLDTVYNLDWFSSASKNECTAAVGLKWMLNQGAMEYNREVVEYFKKRGVSVILLFRRNILRRLISVLANAYDRSAKQLNGTHKSHVHSKQEAVLLAAYKPLINVTFLQTNLQRIEEVTDDAVKFFKSTRHMILYYEDLIKDQMMREVEEFLKVPPHKLESRQVKIHTLPLSEQIENRDEVYKKLKGTKYEVFMEETDYDM
ncbi:uncharacterized protein LOC131069218 isoform X2 [Cryptomeria japonica]|uniref:uncharacterized protein LOC131069218 isoform X2 n=1 Tax=Cryptomeria japonica TaxID=3369 RepID=UPI0025ABC141|nr:uncharacterized protein LOC131069218 isoform X2 [Cryptomeria japonica]